MLKRSVVFFILLLISGCGSGKIENPDLYFIKYIRSDFFSDYHLIIATFNSQTIYIVSEKKLIDNACSDKLKENTYYKISLDLVNSPIKTELEHIQRASSIIFDEKTFWENGKIIGKVYTSPDLKGICISNPNNIFHYP